MVISPTPTWDASLDSVLCYEFIAQAYKYISYLIAGSERSEHLTHNASHCAMQKMDWNRDNYRQ